MDEVKQKYATSKQKILKLLTLLLKLDNLKVADEFGVSKYGVNKACTLKMDEGILAEAVKGLWESLSEETVQK
jgi:hypothetical protein